MPVPSAAPAHPRALLALCDSEVWAPPVPLATPKGLSAEYGRAVREPWELLACVKDLRAWYGWATQAPLAASARLSGLPAECGWAVQELPELLVRARLCPSALPAYPALFSVEPVPPGFHSRHPIQAGAATEPASFQPSPSPLSSSSMIWDRRNRAGPRHPGSDRWDRPAD